MNFFFNCTSCNCKFNFQESYCKYCLTRYVCIVDRYKRNEKISNIEAKRFHIDQLKQRIESMKNNIENENKLLDVKKKYLVTRRNILKKNKQSFEENDTTEVDKLPNTIEQLKLDLNDKILQQKYPKDVVAATLGYTVKLIEMISIILGVVLPHRMKFIGSKSVIQNVDTPTHRIKPAGGGGIGGSLGSMSSTSTTSATNLLLVSGGNTGSQSLPSSVGSGGIPNTTSSTTTVSTIKQDKQLEKKQDKQEKSQQQDKQQPFLPLYFNNKVKSKDYQKALYLLGENIAYLRFQQGLLTPKESHSYFLQNIMELINSSNLGKNGPFTYEKGLDSAHSPTSSSMIYTNIIDDEESKEDWEIINFLPPPPNNTEDIEHMERILNDIVE
ncbi:hypothetical protein DFA_08371 [Cavenderia fasciculata]|uniref:Autophagy-related protein 14 n=1 Tax=Cavenderia fasciculata TaxID=261658 RepID=F4Q5W7_CACFS|nr:uncharacterized protein DFA_08371 [Cavenderia fasciculata]EGG17376.1 hypothetical protein DFA_08371 [Cavenderia fasciculata]|eukprot:XP_004355860.1 hypothetical protein DFA_08371 [Cavenderia fasciculata]